MRGNRGCDTGPERRLRSALHARGRRFRIGIRLRVDSGRPITPDVVFPSRKLAIFVDGCFWHGCPHHGTKPAKNESYWMAKFQRNRERDRRDRKRLEAAGWTVLRFWEHEDPESSAAAVDRLLAASQPGCGGRITGAEQEPERAPS